MNGLIFVLVRIVMDCWLGLSCHGLSIIPDPMNNGRSSIPRSFESSVVLDVVRKAFEPW